MNNTDLGVLGQLAEALGLFVAGSPNGDWFAKPQDYLKTLLSNDKQRHALMQFIDDALGGEERHTVDNIVWLPLVTVPLPAPGGAAGESFGSLAVSITVDELQDDGLHLGLGLQFHTNAPASDTTLAIPLFRAAREGAGSLGPTVLLGTQGGRIRIASHVTLTDEAPVPGQARLGGIGLQVAVPTLGTDPVGPSFGFALTGLQLPGAATPRDMVVHADGVDQLDDALLDLVLSLIKAQADAALSSTPIGALGGLLGLRSGDLVPDFPITALATQGPVAIAHWLQGIVENSLQRNAWMDYLGQLLGVTPGALPDVAPGEVGLTLGPAQARLGLHVRAGASGHTLLAPYLSLQVGSAQTHLKALAELLQVDLVTGQASAFPSLGLWFATGQDLPGQYVLDVSIPAPALTARAATLRVGFALNAARQLNFVLAADQVRLGSHSYPTLDLSSPNAVMDAAAGTVDELANQLLGGLGNALGSVRLLLGLDAPAGISALTVSQVMANPLAAVQGYWLSLAGSAPALKQVLASLHQALADSSRAAFSVQGEGTALRPFSLPLIDPLALEVAVDGHSLHIGVALATSISTLGQGCTVVGTTLRATLAQVDLQNGAVQWLALVQARLSARERGLNPPCARLVLDANTSLLADEVALALQWQAAGSPRGFAVNVDIPNPRLRMADLDIPLTLPQFAPDGSVTLPAEAWDGIQALVGHLARLLAPTGRSVLSDLTQLLGWARAVDARVSTKAGARPLLRLADLVADPAAALRTWLPRLLASPHARQLLELLADVLLGHGNGQGLLQGHGRPDSPFHLVLAANLPQPFLCFGPNGPRPLLLAAPQALRQWRPGDAALPSVALEAALLAEAGVDPALADLMRGRSLADGSERSDGGALTEALDALIARWSGGDGSIVPPASAPAGITLQSLGLAALQLWPALDWADWVGAAPATVVHVAVGPDAASCWPDASAARLIDLSTAGLQAAMFNLPAELASATGDWFVALGTRANSLVTGAAPTGDGTAEQAARLLRVLQALPAAAHAGVVAVGGAGHAARIACQSAVAVDQLLLLGTPLAAVSLSALATQPTADAWRLLGTLLPAAPNPVRVAAGDEEAEDPDLALGRALVQAWQRASALQDAAADLALPTASLPTPRAGLNVTACFGQLSPAQVGQAVTAIVASGLAERARARVQAASENDATALAALGALASAASTVQMGWRWPLQASLSGALLIEGQVEWIALQAGTGLQNQPALRLSLFVRDRGGWLLATPEASLRAFSLDLRLTLDGSSLGTASVVLHEAQAFGHRWEALRLGDAAQWGSSAQALLPEARVLLAAAFQRVADDAGAGTSVALGDVLQALGLADAHGALVGDALDQFLREPATRLRQALAQAGSELPDALRAMLGPLGSAIRFAHEAGQSDYAVTLSGGDASSGRFGWAFDVTLSGAGVAGHLKLGPDAALPGVGGLQLALDFATSATPFSANLIWSHPGGAQDAATLWPTPDGQSLARLFTHAAPSLAAQAALEVLRRADEGARPTIDALLDAMNLLKGSVGDAQRAIRPLAGLLRDPAGWFRSAELLAFQANRVQALFDALRPLMGLGDSAGSPLQLATGVRLSVASAGLGSRLSLDIDPTLWTASGAGQARFGAGLTAQLLLLPDAPPQVGLETHVGLAQSTPANAGRQSIHVRLATTPGQPLQVFLRRATGSDISLVPFAGLGALGDAALSALPLLLDQLALQTATVGPVVSAVGDALGLRRGAPAKFDVDALRLWGNNPTQALLNAAPGLVATAISTLATALDQVMPGGVAVSGLGGQLSVVIGRFSVGFAPATLHVRIVADAVPVPGIEFLSAALEVSPQGLHDIALTVGPADITTGGVHLRPFVQFEAGSDIDDGPRVAVGMASSSTTRFALRWLIGAHKVDLVSSTGAMNAIEEPADKVALQVLNVLADLAFSVALAQAPVTQLLATGVGAKTLADVLDGVLLVNGSAPYAPLPGVFATSTAMERVQVLVKNIAEAGISITLPGTDFAVGFAKQGDILGLELTLKTRYALTHSDVMLWLENDGTWISSDDTNGGLFVGFLPSSGALVFQPSLAVNGLGLRIGKNSGPLIDSGLSVESIALHLCAKADHTGFTGGGMHLEFTNLAVPATGGGGSNGMAQGMLRDTGPTPPKPAFSPGIAIQKHGSAGVEVALRAGKPPGPWWVAIQRGFGPLYLEQVGFDAPVVGGKLQSIALLMDGSVSMFGLSCAVDDLQISYLLPAGGGASDFFAPQNWYVDLAGLAVSANMAGMSLAGGMLKQISFPNTPQESVEYLGMLLGRFGVYGISVYGGFGEGRDEANHKFTAFFAAGAVNGPIGGPPAFFLTGIGGGFGINRALKLPGDMSQFGDYPLIQMLDIAAQPSGNPMDRMRLLAVYFPMKKGHFWFAAGLSFNSFALVDGIAVVGVEVGDGLDLTLLGLARMALPRPQVALVSIELALMVRFSSSEGVLWIQGQLTDNSWLLYNDVKITGGFAYVLWFKGEHAGEFVLTLGGYHPSFSRPGYPVVPRLGLRWAIGDNIVIKAENYFALTSEALMAGGAFEGSAHFGPAWAEVKFGADGIIYFDPFSYDVSAYARIAAGITIDVWVGEITISVSLGAQIHVMGPEFRGSCTFSVGPASLTFDFGGSDQAQRVTLSAGDFVAKYLEVADSPTSALAHAWIMDKGGLPSNKGADTKNTPDGSFDRPFIVTVEFALSFTSTVPATLVGIDAPTPVADVPYDASAHLAIGPLGSGAITPRVVLRWMQDGVLKHFPLTIKSHAYGAFPKGVWGPLGDFNHRQVPSGDMVMALNQLGLACEATPSAPGPEIAFDRVETGPRKPLPFTRAAAEVAALRSLSQSVAGLVSAPASADQAFALAHHYMQGVASPTALAALRGERQAPPLMGTLAEGLESPTATVVPEVVARPAEKAFDHFIDPPLAMGLMRMPLAATQPPAQQPHTRVKDAQRLRRMAAPTVAGVMAARSKSIAAQLTLVDDAVALGRTDATRSTVLAARQVPFTALAQAPQALVAAVGRAREPGGELDRFSQAMLVKTDININIKTGPKAAAKAAAKAATGAQGAELQPGQVAVLHMPNAAHDAAQSARRPSLVVLKGPARLVLLGLGGTLLADTLAVAGSKRSQVALPPGTVHIAALGLGSAQAASGLAGWHTGTQLPYLGWGTAVAAQAVVQSNATGLRGHAQRHLTGWVSGAELSQGECSVSTRFALAPRCVLIALDDPATQGEAVDQRQLLMGLDGARRTTDAQGQDKAPLLLTQGLRSVLAYEVEPLYDAQEQPLPCVVNIAAQAGWHLVGVMASASLSPQAALALLAESGFDAALQPLAQVGDGAVATRIAWQGARRSSAQRVKARAAARGHVAAKALAPLRLSISSKSRTPSLRKGR
jgi:hypothetical protein